MAALKLRIGTKLAISAGLGVLLLAALIVNDAIDGASTIAAAVEEQGAATQPRRGRDRRGLLEGSFFGAVALLGEPSSARRGRKVSLDGTGGVREQPPPVSANRADAAPPGVRAETSPQAS